MNKWTIRFFTIVLFSLPTVSQADAKSNGEALHQENCTRCHTSQVYTRPDRFIHSYESLSKQVRRCEIPAKVQWSDEQVQSVIDYLDTNFYKFK